ncbi:hypothetical protein SAMN03080615_01647 [Amphritea atlantica]|uniref:Uncharacterized protein n=1 Tax=Amphritea atlantica TaxID=355243 RepID=A0A1H9GFA4_9GAMM|nr:hypothetical protein [Amphritea atlantica]SEQ48737.1 hypothetical protein SAMN03080615_01647 [Amphritea atlantica]
MAGVYLSPDEISALYGAPWLVRELYVFGIRPQMDFDSGLVGRFSKISWHGLARELRVESAPGIKEVLPSKAQVRRAAEHLVKRGLVTIKSDGDRLVFKCLVARLNSSAKIKADTKPTQLPGIGSDNVNKPESPVITGGADGESSKADTQPGTPKNQNPAHIRESETLSLHNAESVFSMFPSWEPIGHEWIDEQVKRWGVDVGAISDADGGLIVEELIRYWLDRPEVQLSQRGWESKLVDSVVHHVKTGRVSA